MEVILLAGEPNHVRLPELLSVRQISISGLAWSGVLGEYQASESLVALDLPATGIYIIDIGRGISRPGRRETMQETLVDGTDLVQIGQVAQTLGINPKTIRYYEEIELIPEAPRNSAGYRLYDRADFDRLSFILRARSLDFSLDDIGEILALREDGEAPCMYVTGLVDKRISDIDARIEGLNQLRHELEDIREEAQSLPREDILRKDCICHLIENKALVANGAAP